MTILATVIQTSEPVQLSAKTTTSTTDPGELPIQSATSDPSEPPVTSPVVEPSVQPPTDNWEPSVQPPTDNWEPSAQQPSDNWELPDSPPPTDNWESSAQSPVDNWEPTVQPTTPETVEPSVQPPTFEPVDPSVHPNISAVCDNVDCGRGGVCEPISATEYQCRCLNGSTQLESCSCGGILTGALANLDPLN